MSFADDRADWLTAALAVAWRRTGADRVSVVYTPSAGQEERPAEVAVGDDPSFGALRKRLVAGRAALVKASSVRFPAGEPPAGQVAVALSAGVADPSLPLSCLPLATVLDRRELLGWGGYDLPTAVPRCVHDMVYEQAARTPEAPAVRFAGSTLTYRELCDRADGLAAVLLRHGAGPGRPVAVLLDRSADAVIALLAVLRSGAAYVALELDAPAERRDILLRDAGAHIVISSRDDLGLPPDITLVRPDEQDAPVPPPRVGPADLAYVSYTSGSTGEPKGVCVPHTAVARLVDGPDWADFRSGDVFLQLAPVAFDASTMELWAPLTSGALLVVHPPGPLDLEELAETLAAEGVSVLWLTAGLFHRMVAEHLDALAGLRHLLAGGDVVSVEAVRELMAAHPDLLFTDGYGPTENTTFTTCWTSATPPAIDWVPIGRPIRGTRVAILDSLLRPVPVGVPGELYAGGAGLARCYLGRPGATAERFVADPFAAEPGARLYRTGDLACWQPDHTIRFLGRADQQVKIHGFRVEPGEVEAAIMRRPEVSGALVLAEDDPAGGRRLAAYVTPRDDAADTAGLAADLRAALRRELPPTLVPPRLLVVRRLPLTLNGKVDRAAVAAGTPAPRTVDGPYVAPSDWLESYLTDVWADTLDVEKVGVHDDFFELGGHSLIAGELLGRVQQEFELEIPARTLYLNPTVTELAKEIHRLLAPAGHHAKGSQRS
ncbi:non-ribosomal peptide synthetase [Nonomuraea guangzhouensis]|uniref:Amino acid adenylation domain-containing protein n=1 Tax=Nonomuraea guangzhouensis TaxID=1291555 RepID=A0ABW4GYJ6_9ACTN|nr:non-ribosomal peptide synthetase [Nonomuraea guangzhouensis]